jgi:hypothetical protein
MKGQKNTKYYSARLPVKDIFKLSIYPAEQRPSWLIQLSKLVCLPLRCRLNAAVNRQAPVRSLAMTSHTRQPEWFAGKDFQAKGKITQASPLPWPNLLMA